MYVKLVTVITSCVMAWSAPSTLKRCRPLGALIQHRAKHQRYPRNALKTKCAASTTKTARLPACASAKRGSNFFLILFLHIGVAFGWQYADLGDGGARGARETGGPAWDCVGCLSGLRAWRPPR